MGHKHPGDSLPLASQPASPRATRGLSAHSPAGKWTPLAFWSGPSTWGRLTLQLTLVVWDTSGTLPTPRLPANLPCAPLCPLCPSASNHLTLLQDEVSYFMFRFQLSVSLWLFFCPGLNFSESLSHPPGQGAASCSSGLELAAAGWAPSFHLHPPGSGKKLLAVNQVPSALSGAGTLSGRESCLGSRTRREEGARISLLSQVWFLFLFRSFCPQKRKST